ncbi:MAG: hypothetical protein V4636_20625 [Pseudomonadota bacterium]
MAPALLRSPIEAAGCHTDLPDRLAAPGHILLKRYQVDPNIISSLELGRGPIQVRARTDWHPVQQLAQGMRRHLRTKSRERVGIFSICGRDAVDQNAFETRKNRPPSIEPFDQFDDFVFFENGRTSRKIQIL